LVQIKRRIILSFLILVLTSSLLIGTSFAWFTKLMTDSFSGTFGFVDVDLDVYFDNGVGGRNEAIEVSIVPGVNKPGVYNINIFDSSNIYHFQKFRLNVIVKSNVDTYLRVKIFEQLTLKYINFEGIETELSILIEGQMPFNYDLDEWYDNRLIDNYLYLIPKVKRVDETTPLVYGLIIPFAPATNFSNYSVGYSLQLSISVEAVQAFLGPQHVWGKTQTPWGQPW
jgi:hypothetical protein